MKRAAPYLIFAALTLAVFWKFLLLGESIYLTAVLDIHLGRPIEEPGGLFRPDPPHSGVADNILLLHTNLHLYNQGLKAGELRLWNPLLFCGYPVYSDPMVHPFYPPHLLLHALLPPDAAYEISLMLHLFFSGAAMFWALGALGRSRLAATLGGVAWMLLGYNSLWFSTSILMGVSVFGPLAFLAITRGIREREVPFALLGGSAMGMAILGSHPQHALNTFVFFLAWLLAALLWNPERRRPVARFAVLFVLASVGTGLAAILARLDTIGSGSRGLNEDIAIIYGPEVGNLSFLLGLILGKAYFPGGGLFEFEFTVYVGLGTACLAVLGAVRGFREGTVRFAALAAIVLLVIAFVTPIALLFQYIPILNLSPPSRWIFVAGFCVVLLMARGWDALEGAPRWIALVPAALTVLLVAVLTAGPGPLRWSNGAAVGTLLGFSLVTLAAFFARPPFRSAGDDPSGLGPRLRRLAPVTFSAALIFELLPFFFQFNPHRDGSALRETPEAVGFAGEREKEPWRGTGALGSPRSLENAFYLPEFTIGNNSLALYGVENIAGFEAVIPVHYVQFSREAGATLVSSGRTVFFHDFRSPLLDMAGLKYLFMPFNLTPPPRYRLLRNWGKLKLYENTAAFPRAWMVGGAVAARDMDESTRLIRDPGFRPREAVVIETSEALPPLEPGPVACRIDWKERTSDRLRLEVEAERNGFLVLTETDYPGWEASMDGAPAPLYRANLAFRAVPVPAGKHAVEFVFRPESVRTGLWGSFAFFVLALGFAALLRRPGARER